METGLLYFEEIVIEGFQSIIDSLTYKLDRQGLSVIKAPNGKGKTTIFSALTWGLWGYTLKKNKSPEPWKEFRELSAYNGSKVIIRFRINSSKFDIIRCNNYKGDVLGAPGDSKLFIIKDGKYQSQYRDKADAQEAINQITGYTFNLFKNSIVFGQKMVRLVSATGPDKKEVFEQAFSVIFIKEAQLRAEKKLKKYNQSLQVSSTELEVLKAKQSTLEKSLEDAIVKHKQFKANLKDLETDYNNELLRKENILRVAKETHLKFKESNPAKPDKDKLTKITNELESSGGLNSIYDKQLKDLESLTSQARILNIQINDIKDSCKDRTCRTCGSRIKLKKSELENHNRRIKDLEKKWSELELDIIAQTTLVDNTKRKVSELISRRSKLLNQLEAYHAIERKLDSLKYKSMSAETDLENFKKNKPNRKSPFKSLIDEYKDRIKHLEPDLISKQKDKNKYEKWVAAYSWVLKDPLSNSGIKALIFSNMLKVLNTNLVKYSKFLGFQVVFNVDLSSKRKDISTKILQNGINRDYEDLSGGQQQLVDVCVAFAMHDTLEKGRPVNISIMDELFESLSSENIEKVTDIISDKSQRCSLHLITHKSDYKPPHATIINLLIKNKGKLKLVVN